jgi:hypothetical protein
MSKAIDILGAHLMDVQERLAFAVDDFMHTDCNAAMEEITKLEAVEDSLKSLFEKYKVAGV